MPFNTKARPSHLKPRSLKPREAGSRPHKKSRIPKSQRAERPLREDLVTQAALEAYASIRHDGRLADRALDFALREKRYLYSNERRAVAERVYALLRRQRTVDALLERACKHLDRLSSSEQDALRLATSRVLHGEDVDAVVSGMALSAADVAALGSLARAAATLEALPRAERFPLAASLPDFLASRFLELFGDDAEAEAEALNERAPLTARVNTLKTDRDSLVTRLGTEGVIARPTPFSPFGLFLDTRLNAFALPSFREGLFELQDEGSQLLGMLVDAPPTRVVDACAGAGGKTLQLAAQMKNRGELFALDVDGRRMEELKKRARRDGVHNVRIRTLPLDGAAADAALTDLEGKNDRVLVDAPCSGTGTFRRKPDGRYRLKEEEIPGFAARQEELLLRFSRLVKPGGRLIYGTCSVLTEENEAVVDKVLRALPDFSVVPVADKLGEALAKSLGTGPYLKLSPRRHGTDGFFGAILQRKA